MYVHTLQKEMLNNFSLYFLIHGNIPFKYFRHKLLSFIIIITNYYYYYKSKISPYDSLHMYTCKQTKRESGSEQVFMKEIARL